MFSTPLPNVSQCNTWKERLEARARALHGVADQGVGPTAEDYHNAETLIFKRGQKNSFPEELCLLKAGKPIPSSSRLLTLAPEFDEASKLIRVGGRLRQAEDLDQATVHPIVLDPSRPSTKLLIQDIDS